VAGRDGWAPDLCWPVSRGEGAVKLVAEGWGQLQMDHYGRVDAASANRRRQEDNVVDWNVVDGTAIPHAAFRRRS
jgi:hypothetical protein